MAYVITDLNDFEIQISDGFRDIVIWKQNIRFGAIVGDVLTLYWHNKAQTDTRYQLNLDYNNVTSPAVASAAALQVAIEAMILSGAGTSFQFPIGYIYMSVDPTDPGTVLGYGTWAAFAEGRVLVGVDVTDTDFDTVEETGGEKTHVLTCSEIPDCTDTDPYDDLFLLMGA